MLDHVCHINFVDGVEHIEKVCAVREAAFGELVWHVSHEVRSFLEQWEEIVDAELIVFRHANVLDRCQFQKLFFLRKDLLEKIFVDHRVGRHIQLH